VFATCLLAACGLGRPGSDSLPLQLNNQWRSAPPQGHAAAADRRNLAAGDNLRFQELSVQVLAVRADPGAPARQRAAQLRLTAGDRREERAVTQGEAFNWGAYHVAVVAIGAQGELGAGLVSVEIGELRTLPGVVAASPIAGGAELRLRIPHTITRITLHHTGSPQPLRPGDDPVASLRGLQSWGASDRNWWDVPYHLLLDLDGRVYAGRDWRYMGETNTTYDPRGHLLISVLGNYELQEPTPAQIDAIVGLMAWAVRYFEVPVERIGGHYDFADTGCPGRFLRRYLEDGSLKRLVAERLAGGR